MDRGPRTALFFSVTRTLPCGTQLVWQTSGLAVVPSTIRSGGGHEPDFVNTQAIIARCLTMCLAYPEMQDSLNELISPSGPVVDFMHPKELGIEGLRATFGAVQRIVVAGDRVDGYAVAIGYFHGPNLVRRRSVVAGRSAPHLSLSLSLSLSRHFFNINVLRNKVMGPDPSKKVEWSAAHRIVLIVRDVTPDDDEDDDGEDVDGASDSNDDVSQAM